MKALKTILSCTLLLATLLGLGMSAFAATVDTATIDPSRVGSIDIYKYDLTSAEKDGVWDGSYVSTGVKDSSGVEAVLGNSSRVSDLGNGEKAYGYAIKGVEFTYLRVADIHTYTATENGASHVELLYGIPANAATDTLLSAIGLTTANRYTPADTAAGSSTTYYYQSDTLIDALAASLAANATTVKNALEHYVTDNGGTTMTETDSYGYTSASELPLGLYLIVETAVPEMVTSTTAPFFVSLPMTSVDGSNASNGGEQWLYDLTLYPKNQTGIPSLEKTVREAKADTGHNLGSSDIYDGYAHTATASDGDVVEYQYICTMPSITSEASYLTLFSFRDTLAKGLSYNRDDVVIEFYSDADCTNKLTTWTSSDGTAKFCVNYSADGSTMTIEMTAAGLNEINTSMLVYTAPGMVNAGYSDCTMRVTYSATLQSSDDMVYGDDGNSNSVVLSWQRSNSNYIDLLIDDCHVFSYGIDLTKLFSDDNGNFARVEFVLKNKSDDYFVTAKLVDGVYYVTGHVTDESDATHFVPTAAGKVEIKGLEDDSYTLTEVQTDKHYTLLKDDIDIVIRTAESDMCSVYDADALGVVQNDARYTGEQKYLMHKLLAADAAVDGNAVSMKADESSINAFAPLTVVNTKGFDLPQTGGSGNWLFPAIGLTVTALAVALILVLRKKR